MSHSQRIKSESCDPNSEDDESYASSSDIDETYERLRERQIQENQALLEQLGLAPHQAPVAGPVQPRVVVKREFKPTVTELRRNSRRRTQSSSIVYNGKALTQRNSTGEFLTSRPDRPPPAPSIIYGHIPGVPVLRTWDYRYHIGPMHDGGLRVRTTSCRPAASLCIYTTNLGKNTA
jgi:hypothetical protein